MCGGSLRDHAYAEVASIINEDNRRTSEFISLFEAESWAALRRFQEFAGDREAMTIGAVKCPNQERMIALVYEDPFELFHNNRLIGKKTISGVSATDLDKIIPTGCTDNDRVSIQDPNNNRALAWSDATVRFRWHRSSPREIVVKLRIPGSTPREIVESALVIGSRPPDLGRGRVRRSLGTKLLRDPRRGRS